MSKKMLGDIMREAQKLQTKMAEMQEEAKKKTVEATAGGGMVTVVASGAGEVISIKIEKDVFSQQAFKDFAAENLILMEADFPKKKGRRRRSPLFREAARLWGMDVRRLWPFCPFQGRASVWPR